MDPNACFARIIDALACTDHEEAFYACGDLIGWLEKGGFPVSIAPAGNVQLAALAPAGNVQLAALKELRRLLKAAQR